MSEYRNALQAWSNTAADNISAPVDGIAWLLRKAGIPVPKNALMGSDWMRQRGLTAPVEQGAGQVVGDTLGLLSPFAVQAAAPQIARGLLAVERNALAPRAPGMVGAERGALDVGDAGRGTLSQMSPKQLKDALLAKYAELVAANPWGHFGVRVVSGEKPVAVGEKLTRSSKWVDGVPLTTKLPGTAVFELRQRSAKDAIDQALAYNLGTDGQKILLVQGDSAVHGMMPEAFSTLIKSPRVVSVYDKPNELAKITRAEEVRRLLDAP